MNKIIIPSILGIIVIVGFYVFLPIADLTAEQIYDNCKNDKRCIVDSLNLIAKTEQKNLVLTTFSELSVLYNTIESPCHSVSHRLGIWLYEYTGELDDAFQYASPLCAGGNFHGIFQSYFAQKALEGLEPNEIQFVDLCDRFDENSEPLNQALCIHGIGHGLEALYNYDTVKSAPRCNEFEALSFQKNCLNGVFMERLLDTLETVDRDSDGKELYFPCNENELRNFDTCYIWQSKIILENNDNHVNDSFGECDEIHYEAGIKNCYYGIGQTIWLTVKFDLNKIPPVCEVGERIEYHVYCLRGMVMVASLEHLRNGFNVCPTLDEKFKHQCYDSLGYWIQFNSIDENQKIELCSKSEEKYFDVCMNPDINGISHL